MKLKDTINNLVQLADKKSPEILTGLAVAGTITLTVMVLKPKVEKIMARHREEVDGLDLNKDSMSEEEYKEAKRDICADTAKELAIKSLPTVALSAATCACAIGSHAVSARRVAAISAAYEIASNSLRDYKDKIEEIVPKKAQEIKEAVVKKDIQSNPVTEETRVYSTGRGDVLCKDKYTKLYFRSSMDEIEKAINRMSARVRDESWVSLSDLYYELGIKSSTIPPVANDIGWHDSDLIEGNLPILAVACLDDTGTIPVIGLDYEVDPYFKEGGRFRR
jgi:hypothetical protein